MKSLILISGVLLLLSIQSAAQKQKARSVETADAAEIKVPFTADQWTFQQGKVEFLEYKGAKAVRLNESSGNIVYKNLNFVNGIIEVDVEVSQALPFPSIYFRWQDQNESELVYLRTGVANNPNANDAVQYASIVNGVNLWDLQHEFQSSAHLKVGEWNHVKLVVSGKQLKVYINDPPVPDLEIPCMEGNTKEGKIALGTGFAGQVVFANLIVRPSKTAALAAEAGADLSRHDKRYIRTWQVSKTDSLAFGKEVNPFVLPKADTGWKDISAERRGLVNLSRKFGNSGYRRVVWLRTTIRSAIDQQKNISMGFSDEIWVFMNQRPVYVDKNIYYMGMRKNPDGRISLDNCSFQIPLQKGNNELLIAVANDFFGWGIIARLENMEGITIE